MFDDAYERAVKQACKEELEAIYAVKCGTPNFAIRNGGCVKDILICTWSRIRTFAIKTIERIFEEVSQMKCRELIADLPGRGSFKYQLSI